MAALEWNYLNEHRNTESNCQTELDELHLVLESKYILYLVNLGAPSDTFLAY